MRGMTVKCCDNSLVLKLWYVVPPVVVLLSPLSLVLHLTFIHLLPFFPAVIGRGLAYVLDLWPGRHRD